MVCDEDYSVSKSSREWSCRTIADAMARVCRQAVDDALETSLKALLARGGASKSHTYIQVVEKPEGGWQIVYEELDLFSRRGPVTTRRRPVGGAYVVTNKPTLKECLEVGCDHYGETAMKTELEAVKVRG